MILKIEQSKYYGYQGKTKELFKKKYRGLKLKWMTNVKLGDSIVDGWMNADKSQYLLKLPEEGEFKRFTGNSIGMIEFLKMQGAVEVEGEEKGTHIDYEDKKGFSTMEDRFGRIVGPDVYAHYRTEELLKNMPENWGIKWSDKLKDIVDKKFDKIERKVVKIKRLMKQRDE